MLYFSEFSDDLSMGNAKQSGPSIYAVNQTEKKSDSLNNFLFFFFARLLLAHSYKVKLCRLILIASKSAL